MAHFLKAKKLWSSAVVTQPAPLHLYLSGLAGQVTVVHRRDAFRAEALLASNVTAQTNVKVIWNTEVEEIKGDRQVRTVSLKNNVTSEKTEMPVDAVFVQVGEAPNSQVAKAAGLRN